MRNALAVHGPLLRLAALLVPLASIGCGVHLHSPANQQVAERAQTEFQDARIGEVMNEERARLSELLTQELAAVRRLTLAHRDAALANVIGGSDEGASWGAWKTDINTRLGALLGEKPAQGYGAMIGEVVGAQFGFTEAREALERTRRQYAAASDGTRPPLPACPAGGPLPKPAAEPKDPSEALFAQYVKECANYQNQHARLLAGGGAAQGSVIHKYVVNLATAEKEIEGARAQMLAARAKFQTALKEATRDPSATPKLSAALEELRRVPVFGPEQALTAQLDGVVALLEDLVKAGRSAGASPDRANVAVAATVPSLSQAPQGSGDPPATGPLVLTAEHLRLELERATRQVRLKETRLNLLHQQGVAYLAEMALLRQADTVLAENAAKGCAPASGDALAKTYETTFAGNPTCRDRVVSALLLYADSFTVGRLPEQEIRYLLISLDHGAAVDSSEIALLQWQNLVAIPLGELVSFHRSGITSEEIGRLLEVLGLAAIAARL